MRISSKGKNLFASLFASTRQERYLARYILREYRRGRRLDDVLNDRYVRNRATPQELARLLERPDLVAAIGAQAVADLRSTSAEAAGSSGQVPSNANVGGS